MARLLSVCSTASLLFLATMTVSATAEDLTIPDEGSLSIKSNELRIPNSPAADQSTEDESSKLSDLESTVARRNGPPALSLSVSGWVGEQVIHTINH